MLRKGETFFCEVGNGLAAGMVGLVSSCLESGRNYIHHGARNLSRLRHDIFLNRNVSVVSLVFFKTLSKGLVKSVVNLSGFSKFL